MSGLAEAVLQLKEQHNALISTSLRDIPSMRAFINNSFPYIKNVLRKIDDDNTRPKRRKGFNLVQIENKRYGHLYYVRYSHNGKKINTKFNTHTNNLEEAERFARENKFRLIENYLSKQDGRMFKELEGFYDRETEKLDISDRIRKEYKAVIVNKFIPFLKEEKITCFEQIKKATIRRFQDYIVDRGVRPQTVNNNMKAVRKIFSHLERKEVITENPCDRVKGIPVRDTDKKPRGCYELEKVKGVFGRKWKDELSYLLCSLIYTTGMRNSEIQRMRLGDIELIDGCRFIRIEKSKTANGIRLVPLHKTLYEKIKTWGINNKKGLEPLFDYRPERYSMANNELARRLKVSDEEIERENITFYSGRHYWKTLMSAEGLGEDVEEIFMGHRVSGNVAKLYNHRDKQGRGRMVKKARQVFSILDSCIFNAKP